MQALLRWMTVVSALAGDIRGWLLDFWLLERLVFRVLWFGSQDPNKQCDTLACLGVQSSGFKEGLCRDFDRDSAACCSGVLCLIHTLPQALRHPKSRAFDVALG